MLLLTRAAIVAVVASLASAVACGSAGSVSVTKNQINCKLYWGGGSIPEHPDGASLCAAGVCNYQTQEGCASTELCSPHIDFDAHTVTPTCKAAGTKKARETCDQTQVCGRGLQCVGGICRKLCCGADWSACDPGESCIHQAEADVNERPDPEKMVYAGADLCFPINDCDVFDPKACESEDRTCRIVDPTGAVACAPKSDLVAGDGCDRGHQCGAGLTCADSEDHVNGTCRKLCRWQLCGTPECSDAEGVCVHFARDPIGVGECTPNWPGAPVTPDGGLLYSDSGVVGK